jgi:hypothetical protein
VSEETPTLGRHLDEQARRLTTRSVPARPWAAPFEVLVGRLATLPTPDGGRFSRREAGVPEPAWPEPGPFDEDSAGRGEPPAAPPGRSLPSDVVSRLRPVVGPGVEALRVHDDEAAHETAVAHRADAVTVGQDVYFRQGRFDPREPRGFGLLVHEATHVVERTRPGASWRQATGQATAAEEDLALAREAAVVTDRPAALGGWPAAPRGGDPVRMTAEAVPLGLPRFAAHSPAAPASFPLPGAAPPAAPTAPAATPAARPMTAAIDRPTEPPSVAGPPPLDVDALRERIVRDLKRQLRDEFERGA